MMVLGSAEINIIAPKTMECARSQNFNKNQNAPQASVQDTDLTMKENLLNIRTNFNATYHT